MLVNDKVIKKLNKEKARDRKSVTVILFMVSVINPFNKRRDLKNRILDEGLTIIKKYFTQPTLRIFGYWSLFSAKF